MMGKMKAIVCLARLLNDPSRLLPTGDGVISVMLTVDLLLLALVVWFAVRIVRRSQVQAGVVDPPAEFAAVFADLVNEPGTVAQNERVGEVAAQDRRPNSAAERSLSSLEQAKDGDLYADPIDGVPFTSGEKIHTCRCGVGYRRESLEWMTENLSGRCVHCGCAMESSQVVEACH
jgi:hypothetical protein